MGAIADSRIDTSMFNPCLPNISLYSTKKNKGVRISLNKSPRPKKPQWLLLRSNVICSPTATKAIGLTVLPSFPKTACRIGKIEL